MHIAKDMVVGVEYVLKNDAGEVVDESGHEPLTYIHGHGQIVAGLEKALEGQTKGASLTVSVSPKDGYGEKTTSKTVQVGKEDLPPNADMEIGMAIDAVGPDGKPITLWVVSKDANGLELSLDHPLAGQTLHFEVTIHEVRKATRDELAHGHVHGAGGHHHH